MKGKIPQSEKMLFFIADFAEFSAVYCLVKIYLLLSPRMYYYVDFI